MSADLATRLRTLREEAGITQAEAARRAGLDRQRWYHYESGRLAGRRLTLEVAARMAEALGCSLDELA